MVCSDCERWCRTGGSPICSLCRVSRAVQLLPIDPRICSGNYDLVASILERAIGEVNTWLSIPLGEPPAAFEHRERVIESKQYSNQVSGESSPKKDSGSKEKRRSRDAERREKKRKKELKRQPPRDQLVPLTQVINTASSKRKARSPNLSVAADSHSVGDRAADQGFFVGRCHKKNKGRKHRQRGQDFREQRRGLNQPHRRPTDGSATATSCSSGEDKPSHSQSQGNRQGGSKAQSEGRCETSPRRHA